MYIAISLISSAVTMHNAVITVTDTSTWNNNQLNRSFKKTETAYILKMPWNVCSVWYLVI